MNNATFFRDAGRLEAAYNLRKLYSEGGEGHRDYGYNLGAMLYYPTSPKSPFEYAVKDSDTAFNYRIGEIVKIDGAYDVVTGYIYGCNSSGNYPGRFFGIKTAHHSYNEVPESDCDKYKSDIPKEVFDVVRTQLKAGCPLKEAACQ